jgi:hypothetical protein
MNASIEMSMKEMSMKEIKHLVLIVTHDVDSTSSCRHLVSEAIVQITRELQYVDDKNTIAVGFDGKGVGDPGYTWPLSSSVAIDMVNRLTDNLSSTTGTIKLIQAQVHSKTKSANVYNMAQPRKEGCHRSFTDNRNFFSFAYDGQSSPADTYQPHFSDNVQRIPRGAFQNYEYGGYDSKTKRIARIYFPLELAS